MLKIKCPKCTTKLFIRDEGRQTYNYTVHCIFCGFMKVFPQESDLNDFLEGKILPDPQFLWDEHARKLKDDLASFRSELKSYSSSVDAYLDRVINLSETVNRREPKTKTIGKLFKPTEAQVRRGATHPTNCSCCGSVVFRRKSEVQKSKNFFCQMRCRKEYQSSL